MQPRGLGFPLLRELRRFPIVVRDVRPARTGTPQPSLRVHNPRAFGVKPLSPALDSAGQESGTSNHGDSAFMSWVRIDDNMADHPKVIGLGDLAPLALALQVRALCWCSRYLTDGKLPAEAIPRLLGGFAALCSREVRAKFATGGNADELDWPTIMVQAGLWEVAPNGGYLIHDYLEYNPTRAEVLAGREAARERMKVARNGSSNVRQNNGGTSREVQLPPSPSPTPNKQSPKKTLDTLYPKKWLQPFGKAWQARCGESIPWERLEASLFPLCEKFKCAPVLTAFRGYLNDTEPRYASPARFAATSAQWGLGNGSIPKGPHYPTADEADRAAGITVPPKP